MIQISIYDLKSKNNRAKFHTYILYTSKSKTKYYTKDNILIKVSYNGWVAEWLCRGLQILVDRFNSGPSLINALYVKMLTLYHFPICPFSRKVRMFLLESQLDHELVKINPWKQQEKLIKISRTGLMPALKNNSLVVNGGQSICEYISENKEILDNLIGSSPETRHLDRSIAEFFDIHLFADTSNVIINERFVKFITTSSTPNSSLIRAAKLKIKKYFIYIESLLDVNEYLGSNKFSISDISAASHISVLDYFGDIDWNQSIKVKHWYSLIKSRKSFQKILIDTVEGFLPPEHYKEIDF